MNRDDEFDATLDADGDAAEVLRSLFGYAIKPSAVLFECDEGSYAEQCAAWRDRLLAESLADGLPAGIGQSNKERFDAVAAIVRRGAAVPFVGAGMSVPCGMPGWWNFLVGLARRARCKQRCERLMRGGDFEGAASLVLEALGEGAFVEAYRASFELADDPRGPSVHLPAIARRAVVTTNFDNVLQQVFGRRFVSVFQGRESDDFRPHLACGEQVLLKLHGDIHRPASRILTSSEYSEAYGDGPLFDLGRPIPRALRTLYTSESMLFLGCSLSNDRTIRLFAQVAQAEGGTRYLPRHYAIMPWDGSASRRRALTDLKIYPIWYPRGSYGAVDVLLRHLAEEAA